MRIFAESSAILAWLLGEPRAVAVRQLLDRAGAVAVSQLTLAECHRALVRSQVLQVRSKANLSAAWRALDQEASRWQRVEMSARILGRLREPFPAEPVRTLDAIHLATALVLRASEPAIEFLSLDERLRRSAAALGFPLLPR